ncbi:apolipoprotein A-I-like [Paralichthys olivaceus]|uniref:apolipoprotein A-I-like n=1 Tax=Paralichthys olivaceus TaxID=8255 RepID=UPI00375182D3
MKVLVVLALAVFSVCNADIPSQEAPKIDLERVRYAAWDSFIDMTFATMELVEKFRKTELGQDVEARITQSADSVSEYIAALSSQDFRIQLSEEAEQLKAYLNKGLTVVSNTMEPIAEDLLAKLQTQVEAMIPKTKSLQTQVSG